MTREEIEKKYPDININDRGGTDSFQEGVEIIERDPIAVVLKHPTENMSALELVMTTLHAGGKFDHSSYKVSGGLHGVGVSVVNALSEWCRAEIKREGKTHMQSYSFGDKDKEIEIIGETENTGTKITFKPDASIFTETIEFKYDIIQTRLRELAFLNKNVKIELHDERNGARTSFTMKGGLTSLLNT